MRKVTRPKRKAMETSNSTDISDRDLMDVNKSGPSDTFIVRNQLGNVRLARDSSDSDQRQSPVLASRRAEYGPEPNCSTSTGIRNGLELMFDRSYAENQLCHAQTSRCQALPRRSQALRTRMSMPLVSGHGTGLKSEVQFRFLIDFKIEI